MKLTIEPMSEPIMFKDGDVWSLSVQSPGAYRQMIESLHDQYFQRCDCNTVRLCDERGELLSLSKNILIVHDSYTFDVSSRPIITALLNDLQNKSTIDDDMIQTIEKDILELVGELDLQSCHKLDYKAEVELGDILKMMEVKLAASQQYGLIDKMYSLIEIAGSLLTKRLVIFVNQRCLVSSPEFVSLVEFAAHQQQPILFIDPVDVRAVANENRMVIDEDLYCYKESF